MNILKCKRCGRIWEFKGKNPYRTCCPTCGCMVFLSTRRVEMLELTPEEVARVMEIRNPKPKYGSWVEALGKADKT